MNETINVIIMILTAIIIFTTMITVVNSVIKMQDFSFQKSQENDNSLLQEELQNTKIIITDFK